MERHTRQGWFQCAQPGRLRRLEPGHFDTDAQRQRFDVQAARPMAPARPAPKRPARRIEAAP